MSSKAELIRKTEFAARMNVTRACVSQWVKNGVITPASLHGEGRTQKIYYSRAVEDVRKNRNIGQALGNGLSTGASLDLPVSDHVVPETIDPGSDDGAADQEEVFETRQADVPVSIEEQLKLKKLEQAEIVNRRLADEEKLRLGTLVNANDARDQMTKIAVGIIQIMESGLTEMATAVAEAHGVPQRDVVHTLRNSFRLIREKASQKERQRALALAAENTSIAAE